MATLQEQQRLEAEKARYEAEYKNTVRERRAVANRLNDPNLAQSERNSLNAQYLELDNRAAQLDKNAITAQTELNRVTNQINQGANPPVAGPGGQVPAYANQNTGGNPNQSTATRYQQAAADDQVRLDQANQGLANTNAQIAAAERERAALTDQLRASPPGSPQYEALFAQRNELGRRQAELETQQSALQDDVRVRENSLATNKNNLSLVQEGNPDRVSAPPPAPTMVTNAGIEDPTVQTQEVDATVAGPPVVQPQQSAEEDPQAGGFVYDDNGELIPADSAQAEAIRAEETRVENFSPPPVGGNYTEVFNVETGLFDVVDLDTGEVIATGLTEQQAIIAAQNASVGDTGYPPGTGADTGDPGLTPAQIAAQQEAVRQQATLDRARAQAILQAQRKQANDGDWRVKLRLAPGATYLYRDPEINDRGILYPLSITDGVIFPYTPQIQTAYNANYSSYDLTHSNYRGYFYQNSYAGEITITATFTAQDTNEANYMLAVIHFFRSVTKMFYGQDDAFRGSPPPLVFLQGLGEYQFNLHPCVVSIFNYNLPQDVDYIRARSTNIDGTNLLVRRDRQTLPTNPFSGAIERLKNAGLKKGAVSSPPAPPTLGTQSPTYVPTKLDIQLTLLPVQSRQQVSQEFSLKKYANGDLLKGGFW